MALFMYQAAYTAESWAAQIKNPQNRVETVGKAIVEAAGGKLIGAWYSFGEYDITVVLDVPDAESAASIAIALGSGGALKSSQTTRLFSGAEGVAAIKKAAAVAKVYAPAR